VPYQVFETADRPLCLAAGNDRLFARAAKVMGHPEWAADPRFATGSQRVRHKAELLPLIKAVLLTRPRDAWLAEWDAVGVPSGPVNDIAEVTASPQMAAVDLIQDLPGGGPKVIGLPLSFNRKRPQPRRDSPKLGEHNREVMGRE
jgi:crotonobetainyl-CoA:carnitine CoA-transferase CaiB-like acyl-CoA transferase